MSNTFPDFSKFPAYDIPQRTRKVSDLILILAKSMRDYIDDGSKDVESRNIILAMCEVCVSIPPEWFAPPEKLLLIGTIQNLYGDPFKFINDIEDESISFYNKFAAESDLPHERYTLDRLVDTLHRLHDKEFGSVI
jgi:hypothetical protein